MRIKNNPIYLFVFCLIILRYFLNERVDFVGLENTPSNIIFYCIIAILTVLSKKSDIANIMRYVYLFVFLSVLHFAFSFIILFAFKEIEGVIKALNEYLVFIFYPFALLFTVALLKRIKKVKQNMPINPSEN
jgi:hypothetical protein